MHNLKKIEIGFLSGALFFEIASFYYPFFEDVALLFEWCVFILFVNEIPSLLNRFYRTKFFREKISLRLIIPLSFLILHFIFSFYLGGFLIPFLNTQSISISQFSKMFPLLFLTAFSFLLLMAFLISLKAREMPNLVLKIWKRMFSQDEFAQTRYEMERTRFGRFSGYYTFGLFTSALSLFLFAFWVLTWFLSSLFLLIVVLWLVYDALSLKKKTFFNSLVGALHTSDEQIDLTFGWKGLLRPLFSSSKGATISILVFLCYGIFSVFITVLLPDFLFMLIFWTIFCCWYLFLMLICLTRRLNNELNLFRRLDRKAYATSLPPYKDLVMVLIFVCILAWSIVILFPSYANIYSRVLLLSLSIGVNVAAVVSVAIYLKKRKYKEKEIIEYKCLMHDRYRVAIVSILVSILLSVLSGTHILLECVLVVMVFQTYLIDLEPRTRHWRPLPHSMAYGAAIFVTLAILTLSLSLFNFNEDRPFAHFVLPLFVFSVVFSLYAVIISFHAQTLRFRRLRELQPQDVSKK